MSKFKIGYFADGPWAHNAFKLLINDISIEICFVCLRYDSSDKILGDLANRYNIPLLKHRNINSIDFRNFISKFNCDLFVSMSFNQIFKRDIIELPKFKSINCHAGKLPFYRGRNILNWALINDEKEFGITVHFIDTGIDTGDIILQRTYQITDMDDYKTLLEISHRECANVLYEAIKKIINNTYSRISQYDIHPIGFYCAKRVCGDERLNWNQSSREVFNFVRAICKPGPMARTFIGDIEMKINKVKLIEDVPIYKGTPGQVVGKTTNSLIVKTKDSTIEVVEYDAEVKIRIGDKLI